MSVSSLARMNLERILAGIFQGCPPHKAQVIEDKFNTCITTIRFISDHAVSRSLRERCESASPFPIEWHAPHPPAKPLSRRMRAAWVAHGRI